MLSTTHKAERAVKDRKGFTLVEVIVVLAVLAALAAIAVPMALKIFETAAEDATREEMDNLKRAMIGDTRKLQGSFRSDFGFLGDIGCLPDELRRLYDNGTPALPVWSFVPAKQTGAGWKGPYITGATVGDEADEYLKDQLGNDYAYTAPASGPPVLCPFDAELTSNGPDGQSGNSDDITLTILANETTATIRGSVKDSSGNVLAGVSVDVNYASIGTQFTLPVTTDPNGNYSAAVPFGQRSVQAGSSSASFVLVSGSVSTEGGMNANNDVLFDVTNSSSSAVTVNHITIDCAGTGAVQSSKIKIDNPQVNTTNDVSCGTQRNITGTDFTGSSTPSAPLRVVADSPDTQLPDLISGGAGQTRTITLEDFETSGGGMNDADMRGQTITVTFFSDPSTVITAVTVPIP